MNGLENGTEKHWRGMDPERHELRERAIALLPGGLKAAVAELVRTGTGEKAARALVLNLHLYREKGELE